MSDNSKSTASGGIFGTVWLIATVINWLRPESFPVWIIDFCNIIFWIGLIATIIGIVLIIIVLACRN